MDRLRLASIEITQQCNNLCAYCEQPKSHRNMPLAEFRSLLDSLRSEGVEAVALGGGEPTLHPELKEMLAAAAERGLRAGLTTNARDPRAVAALADLRLLESFGVSAGKGSWTELVAHPRAITNLLLLLGGLPQIAAWAAQAVHCGARHLLLLAYKGGRREFAPSSSEIADAFALLAALGRARGPRCGRRRFLTAPARFDPIMRRRICPHPTGRHPRRLLLPCLRIRRNAVSVAYQQDLETHFPE